MLWARGGSFHAGPRVVVLCFVRHASGNEAGVLRGREVAKLVKSFLA